MTNLVLVYTAMLAMSFGFCPLISRAAGLSGGWTALLLAIGTLPMTMIGVGQMTKLPPVRGLLICLAAGIVNGIGLYAYGRLVSGQWEISRVLPIALAIAPAIIAIGGRVFYGEPLTPAKIAGIAAVAAAIWLLH